jgi:serine/threonine-protein kinase HipA
MKILTVYYHGKEGEALNLGRLTFYEGKGQFEYSDEAIKRNIVLSPYHLGLRKGLIEAPPYPFHGIHGLFNDSLPDGWGLYIMDKIFKAHGIDVSSVTPIDRLAFVGDRAMGALSFQPDEGQKYLTTNLGEIDIDALAEEAVETYIGELDGVIDKLSDVGSPSGGARPKALLGIKGDYAISGTRLLPEDYSHWLIKFPSGKTPDKRSEGSIEYLYSEMAREAGIEFPETRLVSGKDDNHYFMVKRFDRDIHNTRRHMHTLAGLLNLDFRVNMVGYKELLKVSSDLTGSHKETSQLFRRMLFNIMSGNRDDHSKNFSFMINSQEEWVNSPAYDITYNHGMNGEHTMDINGKGKNFSLSDINALAKLFSITPKAVNSMISDISDSLSCWSKEALYHSIPNQQITEITKYIDTHGKLLKP